MICGKMFRSYGGSNRMVRCNDAKGHEGKCGFLLHREPEETSIRQEVLEGLLEGHLDFATRTIEKAQGLIKDIVKGSKHGDKWKESQLREFRKLRKAWKKIDDMMGCY